MQPNWIVAPWPPEFASMLQWQWKERVKPYWTTTARALRKAGVRVAIEMHPNFVAYNPETMLRLRDIAPKVIGCNFDPSHMFWQGVDVVAAIRALGDCIYHCHAKDCRIDRQNTAVNGVLDAKKYTRELERSWIFRTVGYGNNASVWKDIVSNLRLVGYDHVLSIEHEDSVMSGAEGLKKAIAFLKNVVITEPAGEAYWA
jgi:sugar phosphate isomerase/epimerase